LHKLLIKEPEFIDDLLTVNLYLDFEEDARRSMEVYANGLFEALRATSPSRGRVEQYRPKYPFGGKWINPWIDRMARYCSYPLQARRHQRAINHIIDHGYAHLLMALDPRRTVITVHDLIPIAANRGKIPGLRRYRPLLSEFSGRFLRKALWLIAVSQQTKTDLIELCSVPDYKIRVIPQGLSREFRVLAKTSKAELRHRLGLQPKDGFLILITGRQFYKNNETSLRVLHELRRNSNLDCRLLWLGNRLAEQHPEVRQLGLDSVVTGIEPKDTESLVEIYNAVDCLLFPSLYEGFGWPPLEAMACGTPVVCSNAASLPEVVGDAAHVAEPKDAEAFVAHIMTVLTNEAIRTSFIEKGLARASQFSWTKHADAVWAVYHDMQASVRRVPT